MHPGGGFVECREAVDRRHRRGQTGEGGDPQDLHGLGVQVLHQRGAGVELE
jgi:hypothetical protein